MRTVGRILIILAAFAIVMGITYIAVNSGGSSSTGAQSIERGERLDSSNRQFEGNMERRKGGGGLMFGLIKNTGIIAVVVALIALPKSIRQKWKRSVPVLAE